MALCRDGNDFVCASGPDSEVGERFLFAHTVAVVGEEHLNAITHLGGRRIGATGAGILI